MPSYVHTYRHEYIHDPQHSVGCMGRTTSWVADRCTETTMFCYQCRKAQQHAGEEGGRPEKGIDQRCHTIESKRIEWRAIHLVFEVERPMQVRFRPLVGRHRGESGVDSVGLSLIKQLSVWETPTLRSLP
jgi:hypothetical protein